MTISKEQTQTLLNYVASAQPDEMDCDSCFDHMAEFVERELSGKEIPEALQAVQHHLSQCPCCNDEHAALMEALESLGE